jgi:hypothetical protein
MSEANWHSNGRCILLDSRPLTFDKISQQHLYLSRSLLPFPQVLGGNSRVQVILVQTVLWEQCRPHLPLALIRCRIVAAGDALPPLNRISSLLPA